MDIHCMNFVYPPVSIAKNKPASASSVYGDNAAYSANKAVDGNISTRWASKYSVAEWVYIDLQEPTTIQGVFLNWESAYGKSYKIQVSDDAVNWTDVYSTTSGDGGDDSISFAPVSTRYVKMNGIQRGTPYGYSLYEFEVYR